MNHNKEQSMPIRHLKILPALILIFNAISLNAQETGYLYWTQSNPQEVWRSELNNISPERILSGASGEGIAYDGVNKIYWINSGTRVNSRTIIRRSNIDGSSQQTLVDIIGPKANSIALNISAGKMYWLGETALYRASLDGSNSEIIISGLSATKGLVLDVDAGHVYYRASDIWRANLDGSNPIVIIPNSDNFIFNGMVLDTTNNKIYYSDGSHDDGIRRADLDGMNVEVILSGASGGHMQIVNNKLYYVSSSDLSSIIEAELDGSNPQNYLTNILGNINDFELDFVDNRAYLELSNDQRLVKTDLSGTKYQGLMSVLGTPHGIGIDSQDGSLYITDLNNIVATEAFGLNGINLQLNQALIGKARGLAFDSVNDQIYWADLNSVANGVLSNVWTVKAIILKYW